MNREQDTAVLHAIATFGEYSFDATSEEAAATITTLARTFCREYPINQVRKKYKKFKKNPENRRVRNFVERDGLL